MSATREAIAEAVARHREGGALDAGYVLLIDSGAYRSLYGQLVPDSSASASLACGDLPILMTRHYKTCATVVPRSQVRQTPGGLVIVGNPNGGA